MTRCAHCNEPTCGHELNALHLSAGQRRALLGLPKNRDFRPCYTGFQWPTLAHLKSKRLINSVVDGLGGMGPKAMHHLTPKGLRVRALLEADPGCHAGTAIDDPRNGGSEPGSWARHIRDTACMLPESFLKVNHDGGEIIARPEQ